MFALGPIAALATLTALQAPTPAPSTSVAPTPADKSRVLVLALKPLSVSPEQVEVLDALVVDAVAKTRPDVQVVSQGELKQMVELEQTRQATGCDTASCLAELADAMGARYVVFGTLGTLGSSMVLTLNLYDSTKAQSVGRETVRADGADQLADALEPAVAKLVAPIEQGANATLPAASTESGTSVLSIVGWTAIGVGAVTTAALLGVAGWSELTLRDAKAPVADKEIARDAGEPTLYSSAAGILLMGAGAATLIVAAIVDPVLAAGDE